MKIRTLIAAFSLIVAVPVMQAADTSADVTASVAAQIKANPGNAAQIVADAIKANPALAPDIAAAAVKAAPGQAKAITTAAIKAAPDQLTAIAKAETKAVPAQSSNIYTSAIVELNTQLRQNLTSGNAAGAGSTFSSQLSSVIQIYSDGIRAMIAGGSGSNAGDIEIGEKVSATVSSPAA
jgi:hypothetical protein